MENPPIWLDESFIKKREGLTPTGILGFWP